MIFGEACIMDGPGLHKKVMRINRIEDIGFEFLPYIYIYIYIYHAYDGVPASVMHMLPCNFLNGYFSKGAEATPPS